MLVVQAGSTPTDLQGRPTGGPGSGGAGVDAAEDLVPERVLAFTALTERLFHEVIALPAEQLDDGLVRVLGQVSSFLGTDRSYVMRYDHAGRTTSMTHEWCAPGVPSAFASEQLRSFDDFPQEQARLLRHEINEIRDTRHLPPDWELDGGYLAEEGITAIIELPFFARGRVAGLIGFDMVGGPAPWIADDIPVLRSVAALAEHVFRQIEGTDVGGTGAGPRSEFSLSPIPVLVVDAEGRIVSANDPAVEFVGPAGADLVGRPLSELFDPSGAAAVASRWSELSGGDSDSCSVEARLAGAGPEVWCRIDVLADRPAGGAVAGGVVHLWDVSERRRYADELRRTEIRFASLVEALPEAVILVGPDNAPTFVNDAAHDLRSKLLAVGVLEQNGWPALPGDVVDQLTSTYLDAAGSGRTGTVEVRIPTEAGALWLECSMLPQSPPGEAPSMLLVVRDTTVGHQHREELEHQAHHDHLTGLPNRVDFLRRLDAACSQIGRLHRSVGLLFVDLDDFKVVNDSLGHGAGDALLTAMAGRLRTELRDPATVARFGGDEFTVLLTDVDDDDAAAVAARIRSILARPVVHEGRRFVVSSSVGVILADEPVEPADLLRWADAALYEAKAGGRDRVVHVDEALRRRVAERTELGLDLQAASAEELVVHYQPEVDLRTGAIVGAEALVRWQHPRRGLLQPGSFIDLAEENGAVHWIGRAVLVESCRSARRWIAEGLVGDDFVIRVNASVRQLEQAGFGDEVVSALDESGLDASRLTLEVTETTVMRDAALGLVAVGRLRELGVRLAIDDFGTGYSSLQLLKQLPIDVVKIDRGFVDGLPDDPEDRAIVETVVRLTEVLGLGVTAEGVEHQEQVDALLAIGCGTAQGFLFSRPVPADEFEGLLRRR